MARPRKYPVGMKRATAAFEPSTLDEMFRRKAPRESINDFVKRMLRGMP